MARKMKAAVVRAAGAQFVVEERDVPEPGKGEVRVAVEACGICHSDQFVKDGMWPGIEYPRVPGHEVVGRIDAVGADVGWLSEGQRVGVGWHGGHCFACVPCRSGDFLMCENGEVSGITRDGGYAEYMVARAESIAPMPDALDAVEAAPLLCAGVTVYNALRSSGAVAGDLVAVQGIGGLGHLGVQYAKKMGFRTVAVSNGADKEDLARGMGADEYVDASAEDPAEKLTALGGARIILTTVPSGDAMAQVLPGLGRNGELVIVGATTEEVKVSPLLLIQARRGVRGWPSGHARDSEETLLFSAVSGVRPAVEKVPLAEVEEGYRRMIENRARFRVVLTPN